MARQRFVPAAAAFALAALCIVTPARADAIDGNWCFPDGKHFTIQGPSITTPAGNRIEGNYSRHAFTYTAPASEKDGGTTISMVLVNEQTLQLTRGTAGASAAAETWRRCNVTS